ncbi:MAG: carbamoyltransferase HypF [Candidatus Bathyarchaeia archaeon]
MQEIGLLPFIEKEKLRAEIIVKGIVQGVGFRPFIYRIAVENNLTGYVKNKGDASVEVVVEGKRNEVEKFIKSLREKSPPLSQIYDMSVNYALCKGEFVKFSIVESSESGNLSGSVIPFDVAICDRCLEELRDPANRRCGYFFITCTDCGPRYTIIETLPYDRPNTAMQDFPMCEECGKEYSNPADRRFHAQTIACEKCGPKAFLTDSVGKLIEVSDPIREAGRLIENGYIVAVKGYGGFHLAASTTKSETIRRLRRVKHRAQKPFAIMARNLEVVRSFADVTEAEAKLLTSSSRPIVLVRKSRSYYLSELISPGLHTVGVMLPYTGLHYMLFDHVREPAFVMTSANAPSEPIVADNKEALEKLCSIVDFFLFHNRRIVQRCDDSVIRVHGEEKRIIRRSRGYAPSPIQLRHSVKHSSLGIGALENVNSCILLGDKGFITQHIGDVESLETYRFLEESTRHLLAITIGKIEAVGCDLHPRFITTKLAQKFGEEFECPVFPIQHHYAHALSLMGENGVNEMVGIVCDGAGYGLDGNIWGGEVLHCTFEGFRRLGHLEEQPMVGGDLAVKYPLRMAAGILSKVMDVGEWLHYMVGYFPYGVREMKVILREINRNKMPLTSSCGRVLDAVSAILGICYERTYEGEPAMKLESTAMYGEDILKLDPIENGGIIDTTTLVHEVYSRLGRCPVSDLAYSAEAYIARSLAELAVHEARRMGIDTVGFSGGVAYNEHISLEIRKIVEGERLKFLVHNQVPPGDGGVSFGQAIAAGNL